jgi:hypothetical protein
MWGKEDKASKEVSEVEFEAMITRCWQWIEIRLTHHAILRYYKICLN